jgi:hypothetical protein
MKIKKSVFVFLLTVQFPDSTSFEWIRKRETKFFAKIRPSKFLLPLRTSS